MLTPRIRAALVVLAASAGLAGCASLGPYGGVGVGVGNPYGYGSYGNDPYYSGYGYGSPYGYAGYGSGYGYNPYGWYNGYYYPGTGYWVYDTDQNRRPLTDAERAYWNERIKERLRSKYGLGTTTTTAAKENWSGFNRPSGATGTTGTTGTDTADQRVQSRALIRQRALEQQQARSERQQVRSERQEARQQAIGEQREARRVRRGSTDD